MIMSRSKLQRILASLLAVGVLSACAGGNADRTEAAAPAATTDEDSGAEADEPTSNVEEPQGESDGESIEVAKNLFSVEVTLPAMFFEGEDLETAAADARAEGVGEVTVNEDGSLTYRMSKADHREIVAEMETGVLEAVEDITSSGDYPSISDVAHSRDYSEFTMTVNRDEFEGGFDGFAGLGLGLVASYYQLFAGTSADDLEVIVHVADEATGDIIQTTVYPEALED